MPDALVGLVPIIGLAVSAISRWRSSRKESTIILTEATLDQLGDTPHVALSDELVNELEHGRGVEVVTTVAKHSGAASELRAVPPSARGGKLSREDVQFWAILLFSVGGFIWSLVVLSIDSSSEAKYGATATLGWVFGYWFQPDALRRRSAGKG